MRIGIPKENNKDETRVAVVPISVPKLMKLGFEIVLEKGAGENSGYPDSEYEEKGAKIVSRNECLKANICLCVKIPKEEDLNLLNEVKGVLFPVGMMVPQDEISNDMSVSNSLIQANMGTVAYFLSKIFPIFMKKNEGSIVGFGSISSTIGRDINSVYAASKRGLESIFESLSIKALNSAENLLHEGMSGLPSVAIKNIALFGSSSK